MLILIVQETFIQTMDRSHDINSVIAVSSGLIDDLSEEFLAGIILAEVVLVSVQTVFR